MKYYEIPQYKIVFAKTAATFEKKLNDAIEDLNDQHPEITISEQHPSGFLAYLKYTVSNRVPENLEDELQIRGIQIKCNDCPYLQRSNDCRRKKFPCMYAPHQLTYADSPACNRFYEELIRMFLEYKAKTQDQNLQNLISAKSTKLLAADE